MKKPGGGTSRPAETDNDRFERLAAEFYRETRVTAPGKDIATAQGDGLGREVRMRLWREWLEARRGKPKVACPKCGAPADSFCVTVSGRVRDSHRARLDLEGSASSEVPDDLIPCSECGTMAP